MNSSLGHVGSGSLTRDGTPVPPVHCECGVLATEPPGKSYSYFTDEETKYEGGWLTVILFELFPLHYIKQGLPGRKAASTRLTAETRHSAPHPAALDNFRLPQGEEGACGPTQCWTGRGKAGPSLQFRSSPGRVCGIMPWPPITKVFAWCSGFQAVWLSVRKWRHMEAEGGSHGCSEFQQLRSLWLVALPDGPLWCHSLAHVRLSTNVIGWIDRWTDGIT